MRLRPRPMCKAILTSRGHSLAGIARIAGVSESTIRMMARPLSSRQDAYMGQLTARKIARVWARITREEPDKVFDELFEVVDG